MALCRRAARDWHEPEYIGEAEVGSLAGLT